MARDEAKEIIMKRPDFMTVLIVAFLLAGANAALAQVRGDARVAGKVVDENGQPLEGVEIRAVKTGEKQVLTGKTNKRGEWMLNALAAGEWNLEFVKDGFDPQRVTIDLDESGNVPSVAVTLAKPAPPPPDPNVEIQAELKRAQGMIEGSQFADARKVYEDLLAKYPSLHQLHRFIASTYAGEKNYDRAIEQMRLLQEKDPENVDVQLLTAELLIEKGDKAEGLKVLESVDITKVKDPFPFINGAITLINDGKPDDAIAWLEKVYKQFPNLIEFYYYRGRAHLAAERVAEARADLEKFVASAPPTARELPDARKVLEQIKEK